MTRSTSAISAAIKDRAEEEAEVKTGRYSTVEKPANYRYVCVRLRTATISGSAEIRSQISK
jgi:hypothetical protein